jgi:hypothetical protein
MSRARTSSADPPPGRARRVELLGLLVYMLSCTIILAIGEAIHRARQRQAFL